MKHWMMAAPAVALICAGAGPDTAVAAATEQAAPAPSASAQDVAAEITALRALIDAQTSRLDKAEQSLKAQDAIVRAQQIKIYALEAALSAKSAAAETARPSAGDVFVVRRGDTLSAIARRSGVAAPVLAQENALKPPYRLYPGQTLRAPHLASLAAAEPALSNSESAAPLAGAAAANNPPVKVAAQTTEVTPGERPDVTKRVIEEARRAPDKAPNEATPTEVGVKPEEEGARPTVAVLPDVGGVLTPRGAFYVEPSFDYTTTADNRFFFNGTEIEDVVFIGAFDASTTDRRAKTASLGVRYGVTNRLEVDGRASYVDRNDEFRDTAVEGGASTLRVVRGRGVGDAEFGLHYQLNHGRNWPYVIGNFRAKAPTGSGPFDVARTTSGEDAELATGSGYWTLEPSFTFILPSDPAVLFANFGYQANLKTRPDITIGTQHILEFDAGDALRASIGVGLSVNDRMSISLGYDQTNFFKSKTLVERPLNQLIVRDSLAQSSVVVGSFLFGASYEASPRLRLNVNTAYGATDAAPDIRATIRAQYQLWK